MSDKQSSKNNSVIIIGALFFIFGFVTWLNGTLIPYLQIACELTNKEAYFITFAFYIAYFVMAIPSSYILQKTGFKNGMMAGLIVMAVGALIFIPAAITRTYSVFLIGLFVIATGLTLLQTAANPYVTIVGPIESAAKRISIMGICNKVAGILSPVILAPIVLNKADELKKTLAGMTATERIPVLDDLSSKVIVPYIVITIVLLSLALWIRFSGLPEIDAVENAESDFNKIADTSNQKTSIFQFPYLILGGLAIFFCVAVEVIAADTMANYGNFQGIKLDDAKYFPAYTLTAMVIGYLIGIATIPKYLSQRTALKLTAIIGILFTMAALFSSGYVSVLFIALLGLANSLMWPAIWPLALNKLGKFTKTGSSLLIMGIAGGAVMPVIYGSVADISNLQMAYWVLVPCYIYILYYALSGYKMGLNTQQ